MQKTPWTGTAVVLSSEPSPCCRHSSGRGTLDFPGESLLKSARESGCCLVCLSFVREYVSPLLLAREFDAIDEADTNIERFKVLFLLLYSPGEEVSWSW